jgi:hypothetical protein
MYSLSHPWSGLADIAYAPGTEFHAWRILDVPIVDTIGAAVLAFLIARYQKYEFLTVFAIVVAISIPLHSAFGVKSVLAKPLFR